MKLEKLCCPSCGAAIEVNVKGHKTIFCPYCGSQLSEEDADRTYTHNININERYTDDAAVERERRKDRENEREHKESKWMTIGFVLFFLVGIAFLYFRPLKEDWDKQRAIDAGMIQIGISSEDMAGKKYKGVEAQLSAAGFTNIITVDLDDAGLLTKRADTIDSVSIDGDSSFRASDFFDPSSKIIISFH